MAGVWIHGLLLVVAALLAARGPVALPAGFQRNGQILVGMGVLGSGVVLIGVHWGDSIGQAVQRIALGLAGLVTGDWIGRLLRLQRLSNRMGRDAARLWGHPGGTGGPGTSGDLFRLLAFSPMAWLGVLAQGTGGDWRPLALKGVIEAMSLLGLPASAVRRVPIALLGAIVWQGTLATAGLYLVPWLERHSLLDPVLVQTGLLLVATAPVVLGVYKVPLANYLPALITGPALAALWR